MNQPRILAFAGSLRVRSYNKRVLRFVAREIELAGGEVTVIDLEQYAMPLYNPDEHELNGFDSNALGFQKLLATHDGLLIATPEYNGSFPAALKNAFEWATRPSGVYDRKQMFPGKIVGLISSSPGQLGGARALTHLRGVLSGLGMLVLGQEVVIPFVDQKIDESSEFVSDTKTADSLKQFAALLVQTVITFRLHVT